MIKLVAADMDGTLLNSKKQLPEKLFPTIDRLHGHGVKFAVASGRQYYNLLNIYDSIKDEVIFIAENGAVVFDKGENIYYSALPRQLIIDVLEAMAKIEGAYPILCGLDSAYLIPHTKEFVEHADMYYANCQQVNDLYPFIETDHICKIAIYTTVHSDTIYPFLKEFTENFKVVVSAKDWIDIMNPEVNKGTAIEMVRKNYNISFEETMAFGDYLNDYEMMEASYFSYVMANGHEKLKKIANFLAPSNDDDGVIVILEEYLEKMDAKKQDQLKKTLMDSARKARVNTYSPYSNFPVGAALLCKDGKVITGVNVENVSFGATNCAERTAIFTAITQGYKKGDFSAIAIAGKTEGFLPPCCICRQVMVEFFDPGLPVYLTNGADEIKEYLLKDLVPLSFTELDI